MSNERETERIVREHFTKDPLFKNINFEEQRSKKLRVTSLLKSSSKNLTGKHGAPDFIISFDDVSDLVIVIECKSDNKFHESKDQSRPSEYAVDGVLHYSKFLNKDFDVLGIAVSGENLKELKVAHFFFRRNADQCQKRIQDSKLLSIYDYLCLYKGEESAKSIEHLSITETAISLNETLHEHSIPEYERCTLISAMLLALRDKAFRKSYKDVAFTNKENGELVATPDRLVDSIIKNVTNVLKDNNIDQDRIDKMLHEYNKIRGYKLVTPKIKGKRSDVQENNFVLRDIIVGLEQEILPLLEQGDKGYDVLGKFYTEFIRYAGTDKKTGLVLTPPHITDLFCHIANLDTTSVVFDPCCGTGGFLVSALKHLLDSAGANNELKQQVKNKHLVGIEQRSDMFTFACSNMMMSGDGKSHVYLGDCFDEAKISIVKKLKPNVAFLNPPYDVGESGQLKFIENACDILEPRGICVAVVQMSCAISAKKEALAVKERLLKNHTLKAVFSMPDELFYPVGVVTCVMVFETHKPHFIGYKTYFGYWKDDGFIKKKNKGRIDYYHKWKKIKQDWLTSYRNSDEIPGISVKKAVTYEDEWCAEAYIETDYSQLTQEDFIKTVRNFVAFKFTNSKIDCIKPNPKNTISIDFNIGMWHLFYLSDFFDMKAGKYYPTDSYSEGDTPLITASEHNNGIAKFTDLPPIYVNCLTIGKIGISTYYQSIPFVASSDVTILEPKTNILFNQYIGLFLAIILNQEKYKWSYGRQIRLNDCQKLAVKLPFTPEGKPDWEFMENYIKSLPYSSSL